MFGKIKTLFLLLFCSLFFSCISEGSYDCGIYLEFRFTHNMEYADSFNPQVKSVDIFVFDESGLFLFTRRCECETDLIDHKRVYLDEGLTIGETYRILTVGNLCDAFCFSDGEGSACTVGVTTIGEIRLALECDTERVSHEFPHLWYGPEIQVEYQADHSVHTVPLVRNTNNFIFALSRLNTGPTREDSEENPDGDSEENPEQPAPPVRVPYTFEIVTPERGVYGYDNDPLTRDPLHYRPYHLTAGSTPQSLSVGYLNTMRLFNVEDEYRLIIRSTNTGKELWNYDLMYLLRETKPLSRPDGTPLPMEEYLDRRGEWEIVILHQGDEEDEQGFLAVGVEINNWILWLHDMDL